MKKGFRLLESKKKIGEARSLFHTISPFINCTQRANAIISCVSLSGSILFDKKDK